MGGAVRGGRSAQLFHQSSPHGQHQHSNTAATAVLELVALLFGGGDGDGGETLLRHRVSPAEGFGARGRRGEQRRQPWVAAAGAGGGGDGWV